MIRESRNNQLRQIKAASRVLFDTDEAAMRACYLQVTGVERCRDMTDAQLRQLGDYMARATGHKPGRKVALRTSCSLDLADRLAKASSWPVPTGWRHHPLWTRKVWRTHTGRDTAVPFEHLDTGDQLRLYKATLAIYRKCGVPREAEERELEATGIPHYYPRGNRRGDAGVRVRPAKPAPDDWADDGLLPV
ncbi:MAG: hypothetical protein KF684_04280 [Phycisphaeraceae bacterium]|nr:hypothetical protein [Phycisphaeraceae bacterium]